MSTSKRMLSAVFALLLVLASVPLGTFAGLDLGSFALAADADQKTVTLSQCAVGDIIAYGSYPQTKVTDETKASFLR